MGKFSDYIENINSQTNILRENLTNATGVDCSKKSICGCADVVADYVPDLEKEEVYYDRPSWYPDIKAILNSAPEIVKDGKTYYPAYIVLINNKYEQTAFYSTHLSTTDGVANVYSSTGGDAVLCSDMCNNDISNANSETLIVGSKIAHVWDISKDIEDPIGKDLIKVRWAIIYNSNKTIKSFYVSNNKDWVEVVTGSVTLNTSSFVCESNSKNHNYSIQYIELQENTVWEIISTSGCLSYLKNLCVLICNCKTTIWESSLTGVDNIKFFKLPVCQFNSTFQNTLYGLLKFEIPKGVVFTSGTFNPSCYVLKSITIPEGFNFSKGLNNLNSVETIVFEKGNNITGTSNIQTGVNCYNLKTLILPEDLKILTYGFSNCYNLKYVKIPSSVENITTVAKTFGYTTYIELFNDFNISAVNFTGVTTKDLQWLRDLCIWLKDRTGDTANTMIIGSVNLENAQNLWLTFNPDNKRDITWVDAGTEGAINIVEFITSELNWSLS